MTARLLEKGDEILKAKFRPPSRAPPLAMPDAAFAAAVVISTCLAEASSDVVAAVTCSDVVAVVLWIDAAEGIWSPKHRRT